MENKDIESYFENLTSLGVAHSKNLAFFLEAERKFFDSKKSRDSSLKEMFGKIMSAGGSKIDLATVPVSDASKLKTMAPEDERKLESFMDQLIEYSESAKENHKK